MKLYSFNGCFLSVLSCSVVQYVVLSFLHSPIYGLSSLSQPDKSRLPLHKLTYVSLFLFFFVVSDVWTRSLLFMT